MPGAIANTRIPLLHAFLWTNKDALQIWSAFPERHPGQRFSKMGCSISNDQYVGCVLYSLSSSASPEPVAHLPRNYLQNLLLRRLPFLVWKGNKQFSKSQVKVQSAIALHTHLKQSFCLALRPSSNVMVWAWATAGLATRISKRAFQYWCQILITLKICNSDIDKHHASVFWIMAIPFFLFSCWQLSSSCQKQKKCITNVTIFQVCIHWSIQYRTETLPAWKFWG